MTVRKERLKAAHALCSTAEFEKKIQIAVLRSLGFRNLIWQRVRRKYTPLARVAQQGAVLASGPHTSQRREVLLAADFFSRATPLGRFEGIRVQFHVPATSGGETYFRRPISKYRVVTSI